jgi:predicted AAA+ superfamily ATPase
LLISCYGSDVQKLIIQGKLGANKGAIYENMVATILNKKNRSLYFFQKNKTIGKEYSNFEIDFVTFNNSKVNLIECKSSNGTAKSLFKVMSHNSKVLGYKFVNGGFGENDLFKTIPLYMIYYIFNEFL